MSDWTDWITRPNCNHEPMTYDQWVEWMTIKIEWNGRRWHNYGISRGMKPYVEDWTCGERVWLTPKQHRELSFNIPVDIRYIPIGNRNYSSEMWPAYLEMGADKWKWPTYEEMGWTNPPPPLTDNE